jgi:RNA polymerase sigma factor (sigma-70 family)
MATGPAVSVVRHIGKLVATKEYSRLTDRELLRRFSKRHDEEAFSALVQRHSSMVVNVCRRILHNAHDADDAFQATFLVLMKRAATLRWRDSVAGWLHETAYRIAVNAKRTAIRRGIKEGRAARAACEDPVNELTVREAQTVLHEELHRLPERLRAPLVLCYLENATQDEASRQLGWSLRTIKRRLERGRMLLQLRLLRRGLTLAAALSTSLLAPASASENLIASTVKAAVFFVAGKTAGSISAPVAVLVDGALRFLWTAKVKWLAALWALASLVGTGIVLTGGQPRSESPAAIKQADHSTKPPVTEEPGDRLMMPGVERKADRLGDPLPADAVARLGTMRLRHGDLVRRVGFFPDGKALISADWHGVHVWDAATGQHQRRFGDTRGRQFQSIAFSADAQTVALTMSDGDIDIWDAPTGRLLRQFRAGRFPSVVLSPDGKTLAVLDHDNTDRDALKLWDAISGKELYRLTGHHDRVHNFVFSHDGKTLISSGDDKSVRFWNVATGKQVREFTHTEPIARIAIAPDGKTLASVGAKKFEASNKESTITTWRAFDYVVLWDVVTGKETHRLKGHEENGVVAIAFTRDSKVLASSDWRKVHWWDVASGKEMSKLGLQAGRVVDFAFARDGKTFATGDAFQTVRLWDLSIGKEVLPRRGHSGAVHGLAISPDSRTIATGGEDEGIRLWELATGKERGQFSGPEKGAWSLEFAPDGRTLIASGLDGTVSAWKIETRKELRQFPGSGAKLSPDGRFLVTMDEKAGTIRVWNPTTGEEIRSWQAPKEGSSLLGFSDDARTLYCWGEDKRVRLWDLSQGKELRQFAGHHFDGDSLDRTYCCASSPNGELIAFGGQLNYVALHDMATGKEAKRLTGLPGAVSSLAFSPDSRLLASGDWTGGTVRLWELASGQEFRQFRGHQGRIFQMAFSADGSTLVTGSEDTTALVWDITGQRTKHRTNPLSRQDLEASWAAMAGDDVARAQQAVHVLTADPKQAIPFFAKHLEPVRSVDAKSLARLLSELGSENFAAREKAHAQLAKLGDRAEPGLRKALSEQSSTEVRQHVAELLATWERGSASGWLRSVRSLEVLEYIGTLEARQVLEKLANGAPEARLTREAQTSLQRLAKRYRSGQ